jgi:hypothetical protein
VEALARFSAQMTDRIGRGAAGADPDLQTASNLLHYPPDVWVWNPSVSLWPTASSESQYRQAARALRQYNRRLALGQATFDRGGASLQAALDDIAADLGTQAAAIQDHVAKTAGFPLESRTDDVFYTAKGRMYGYYVVLNGLRTDFAPLIARRNLAAPWAAMMDSLRAGIALEPMIVLDGAPDSDFFACTLCGEGLYVSRAQAQLREIGDILRQ